jgi:energy-coupling factor transport system substrate-specific component
MPRNFFITLAIILIFGIGLAISLIEAFVDDYFWISVYTICLAVGIFFFRFEWHKVSIYSLVWMASLAALAAASRIPFATIPSVTPTSFIVIVSAIVLGADAGFMIGATAALVSNFVLGQGPWTLWQMFSWGMMGATAGWLSHVLLRFKWTRLFFGAGWGFLFGWIMNISFVFALSSSWSWKSFWTATLASFYFDLTHAISNVFFLAVFGSAWIRILLRYQERYATSKNEISK